MEGWCLRQADGLMAPLVVAQTRRFVEAQPGLRPENRDVLLETQ